MSDTTNYNAHEFQTTNFVKKDELRKSGPMRFTIKAVEKATGLPKGNKPAQDILQLTSSDDRRFGLSAQVNLRRVIDAFGPQTSAWVGQVIELYYSPDVRGPGGEEGGIRVRTPEPAAAVAVPNYGDALSSELPPAKGGGYVPF